MIISLLTTSLFLITGFESFSMPRDATPRTEQLDYLPSAPPTSNARAEPPTVASHGSQTYVVLSTHLHLSEL